MKSDQNINKTYQIRFLSESDKPAIYNTFIQAFSDYPIDMSYMTETVLFNRAEKNGVRYDLSAGVFDKDRMVGFTLVGCGDWEGDKAAFDSGTGIIPSFRHRGLAGQMLDHIQASLKEHSIKRFVLEVLKANEAAIRAYQKSGFQISREFEGLKIDRSLYVPGKTTNNFDIVCSDTHILLEFEDELDWNPSWEENFTAIRNIPDEIQIYTAIQQGQPVGLLIYYPLLKWVMTLVIKKKHRRKGIASSLLNHLFKKLPDDRTEMEIKVVNILSKDQAMLQLFKRCGFVNYADQYEMVLEIR